MVFVHRLASKYGTKFYWQENGEEASISNAVSAIDSCFREEPGRSKCSKVQGELGEAASTDVGSGSGTGAAYGAATGSEGMGSAGAGAADTGSLIAGATADTAAGATAGAAAA